MTMILTCLTKDYVVQASDRRITTTQDGKIEIYDSQSNKALIYCNRFVFAYTGWTYLPFRQNGKTTHLTAIEWAANQLSEGKDLDDGIQLLRSRLTDLMNTNSIRKLSYGSRMLTIVGSGFDEVEEAGRLVRKPRRIVISNCLENDGSLRRYPRNMFTVDTYRPEEDRYVSLCVSGQQLSEERLIEFTRILKLCVQRKGPEIIGNLLSNEIKSVARSGNDYVGEDIMCTFVPRAFVYDGSMNIHLGAVQMNLPTQSSESQLLVPAENVPDRQRFVIFPPFDSPRCFYVSGDGKPLPYFSAIYVFPGQVVPSISTSDLSVTFTPHS